jgi:hypothetical protein
MFVRFRQQRHRLGASLVENRRVDGKVRAEHIGSLGSVDADISVRERIAFWGALPDRLEALGNRVDKQEHLRIYDAVHARIPAVTEEDIRSVQEESAGDDHKFWDVLHGLYASHIEGQKALVASATAKIAEMEPGAADASEHASAARERMEKIKRGERVAGGIGKRIDFDAVLKAAGFTPGQMRRMALFGRLTDAEFKTMLARSKAVEASDKAAEREARRILRARTRP